MSIPCLPRVTVCCALLSLPASAQSFQFQVDPSQSQTTLNNTIVSTLPSTVIGDYDPVTNPGGTSTLPGLFGGSGNHQIPMDLALTVDSSFSNPTTGSFQLDADIGSLSVLIAGLQLDLLAGGTAGSTLSLSMLFDNFHTVAPDSIYFGGIPFDVPLGDTTISQMTLVQTGPGAGGVLVPTADPNVFTIVASVPADFSFLVDFQGQQTPVGPAPVLLPVTGILTLNGQQATVTISVDLVDQQLITDPAPGFAITDQPLPLPTVLPPGSTANLLLSAVISQLTTDLLLDIDVFANSGTACGIESFCSSAVNSTGQAALLDITGDLDVSVGLLNFAVSQLPVNRPGIFFMSMANANLPGFGGSQGTLCVGAPQLRFPQVQFSDGAGNVVFSPDFANLPGGVSFQPDSTWHLQFWYRDSNPMATSNTSNGVRVQFCP